MSRETLDEMNAVKLTRKILQPMSRAEVDQFLTCARVGRVGIALDDGPYIVPVGYAYEGGEIFFHSCFTGLKMDGMRENPNVCFEVDESTSDASMYKSVIARGTVEIIEDRERMRPYLQRLIDKYRVPVGFDEYMGRPGRYPDKEMSVVRVCVVRPREMTGQLMVRIDRESI